MAKAVLEFTLPEERKEHLCAVHGQDLSFLISDFDQHLRDKIKYADDDDKLTSGRQAARDYLRELLNEAGLYNLIFEE